MALIVFMTRKLLLITQKWIKCHKCDFVLINRGDTVRRMIVKIVERCIEKQIITSADSEWFRYGLERRILTAFVGIPFLFLAVMLTDIWGAIGFMGSFFLLRSKINGYHAKTPVQCMISSVLLEVLFLSVVYPRMGRFICLLIMTVSLVAIFFLAPSNDPSIHLDSRELKLFRKSARIRMVLLFALASIAVVLNIDGVAKGITSGSAMAVLLLCSAYIFEGRCKNGESEEASA